MILRDKMLDDIAHSLNRRVSCSPTTFILQGNTHTNKCQDDSQNSPGQDIAPVVLVIAHA